MFLGRTFLGFRSNFLEFECYANSHKTLANKLSALSLSMKFLKLGNGKKYYFYVEPEKKVTRGHILCTKLTLAIKNLASNDQIDLLFEKCN